MKRLIAIKPMATSVFAAFLPEGFLKALTPFEIASTPVSAAAPEAKACRRTNTPTTPRPAATGCGATARGHWPTAHFPTPVATIAYIAATNAYVGTAKRMPDSRTPRRLATGGIERRGREGAPSGPRSAGAADVRARPPAATETATVRM